MTLRFPLRSFREALSVSGHLPFAWFTLNKQANQLRYDRRFSGLIPVKRQRHRFSLEHRLFTMAILSNSPKRERMRGGS